MECPRFLLPSVRLDPRELDHLSPLSGLVGDELAEVDGRASKRDAPNVCDARLQLGIDEAGIDLFVELVDDLGWCVFGNADPIPLAGLVARHELAHGWELGQRL